MVLGALPSGPYFTFFLLPFYFGPFLLAPFYSKFFLAPGVGADSVVGDRARIDDDGLVPIGVQLHLAEVERGGLEGVEEESGDFRIELPGEDEAHDLHERDLDGVGVLEDGHGEAGRLGVGLGVQRNAVQRNALAPPFVVKETVAALAKSRGAALGAIGFDVSATWDMDVVEHKECSTPLPRV